MNEIDTSITHITAKGGNIFEDLGFKPEEAAEKYPNDRDSIIEVYNVLRKGTFETPQNF